MALLAAFCVILLAATTQAVTGFGFALIAVPLLALATDPRTAVVGTSLAGILLTLNVAARERAHVRWRTATLVFGAALLGMPVGLAILRLAPERVLAIVIAVVVLGCTVLVWRQARIGTGSGTVGVVGLASGILGTATGMNGPPLVAAFRAMGYDPRTFRATLAAVFAASGVAGLVGFALAGQVTHAATLVGVVGLPAVLLGWLLGNRLFNIFDEKTYRRLVLAALSATTMITLVRAALT